MTGGSMNLRKFNMDNLPAQDKRLLVGEYKKTILTLVGGSGIGKSTLAELLIPSKFNYISIDLACLQSDIPKIKQFIIEAEEKGENINLNLGLFIKRISEECPEEFIDYFFSTYIVGNEASNILVEGVVLIFNNMFELFKSKCESADYRLWAIGRIF